MKKARLPQQLRLFPWLLLLLLSLLLLPSRYQSWLRSVERGGLAVLQPLLIATSYGGDRVLATIKTMVNVNHWEKQYRQLQAKNWVLTSELTYLRAMAQDTAILRQQLQFQKVYQPTLVVAEISATISAGGKRIWFIDKGVNAQISANMPVLGFDNGVAALVGTVSEVNTNSAIILPILSRESSVTARLDNTNFTGLVKGNDWQLSMYYVSRLAQEGVVPGELVVTAGLEASLFPSGLPIGKVIRVDDSGYEASITMQLEPLLDISRLRYLLVITNQNSGESGET